MSTIFRKPGSSLPTLKLISSKMQSDVRISKIPRRDRIIRWGCRIEAANSVIVANNGIAIGKSSNKALARLSLGAVGVPIPATAFNTQQVEALPNGVEYVHRPEFHHAGANFTVCDKPTAVRLIRRGGYVSVLIRKTNEYRVHAAHGKVLAIQEKPIPQNDHRANMSVSDIPWRVLRREEWSPKMCRMAIQAVSVFGLDFGAVDIIRGPGGKSDYYVLEVNTAPEISSEIVSGKYAKYFDWIFRSNAKRNHYDVGPRRSGPKFAWTEVDFAS